jgi:hypothetical protein
MSASFDQTGSHSSDECVESVVNRVGRRRHIGRDDLVGCCNLGGGRVYGRLSLGDDGLSMRMELRSRLKDGESEVCWIRKL